MKSDNLDKSFLVDDKYAIEDLADLNQLRQLFEQFIRATGFTIGILDHPGLNILIGTGWRDICTKYHRMCTLAAANCVKSNRQLVDQLDEPGKLAIEACDNGLVDCATPIIIHGKHIATLVTGQLLLQEPDLERFKRQARLFGFDEAEYLKALAEIPVVNEEKLKTVTAFLGEMALVISQMGYTRLLVQEETERMAIEIAERKRAEDSLRDSQQQIKRHMLFLDALLSAIPIPVFYKDANLRYLGCNRTYTEMMGVDQDDLIGKTVYDLWPCELAEKYDQADLELIQNPGIQTYESKVKDKNSEIREVVFGKNVFFKEDGAIGGIVGAYFDITERKKAEDALLESRNYLEEIINSVADPIFVKDRQHRWVLLNDAFCNFMGYKCEELFGKSDYDFFPKNEADVFWAKDEIVFTSGMENINEEDFTDANGTVHIIITKKTLYTDVKGEKFIVGIIRDITELKRAEEARRKSEEMFATTFMASPDSLVLARMSDGKIIEVNDTFLHAMGYSRDEVIGKMARELEIWTKPEHRKKYVTVLQETGAVNGMETAFRTKDGRIIPALISGRLIEIQGQMCSISITHNITQRKRAESLIRDSEEKFRTLVDNLNVGVYRNTGDFHGRFIQANPAMINMFSYDSLEEFMKIGVSDLYQDPEERKYFIEEIRRCGHVKDKELALRKKDGSPMWASISATAQRDEEGEIKWMDGVVEDITERKKIEVALRESEQRLKIILHGTPIATFVIGRDHRVIHWNDALEQLSGINAGTIIGTKDQWRAFYDRERPCLSDLIVDGSLKTIPDWYSGKYTESKLIDEAYEATDFFPSLGDKGKWLRFTAAAIRNAAGDLIGAIETLEDITDRILSEEGRKRLETQLAQAQKMEAIGTLAGGIAHDFNNILSAIIGYTQLAMLDLQDKEKAENELNEVLKAGGRAKDLVSHILMFSRKTETEYSPIELPSIIKESLKMLRSVIPTSIEIRQDLIKSGLVMSDPTQIHQVIINLCTNAVQAMDETGGVLEVILKKITINGDAAARDLDLSSGPYFRLTVRDTGLGMPPEVMERIFEPYFTTKELGRGTGLGLSVVHGIVKNHQGAITCKSTPGEGTTFDIYIPELESGKEALKPLDDKLLQTGTERLLFIDDEPVLVDMAKKMLGDLGYRVFTETSSVEALEVFKGDPNQFDLVITDMTMPAMTGDKLAQKIMDIRRDIPVILCSGYSEHISVEKAKKIGIREFVMKPLEMKELTKIIRKVLDGG